MHRELGSHTLPTGRNRTKWGILPASAGVTERPDTAAWLVGLATVIWAIVLDQGTKLWAGGAAARGVEIAHNPRYALGVLGGSVPVLIIGTIVVLGVFAVVIVPFAFRLGLPAWIPGLVLGGALSNMIDRARFGAVRDFIATHWAIINVADLCVLGGVLILPVLLAMRCARLYAERERAATPHPSRG